MLDYWVFVHAGGFFTFLMIVVLLCHSKMLQLSADVSEDTSACVCLMTARSFDFCCWHFCYLYCDSINRALFVGKPLLFTECLRSIVCWTLFVECFSVVVQDNWHLTQRSLASLVLKCFSYPCLKLACHLQLHFCPALTARHLYPVPTCSEIVYFRETFSAKRSLFIIILKASMPLACCPPTKLTVQGKLVLWKLVRQERWCFTFTFSRCW